MGQSYGGYSTMGLVTQTNRFKAAISLAGLSNLVSIYSQIGARRRYADDAHEDLFRLSISETGQTSMGSPPWQDLQRYIRNSPITHVHRVETPILIIQGDLDYVPIQQGEEFFMSLLRQNKRARFARYWGEGHVFHSPANIKHMWEQIYVWLDEFLGNTSTGDGTGTY
jgi:dipeptidyl aminopeptidase/acylaminoacyl peptidase